MSKMSKLLDEQDEVNAVVAGVEIPTTPSSSDDLAREFASDWSEETEYNKAADHVINWPEAGAEAAREVEDDEAIQVEEPVQELSLIHI